MADVNPKLLIEVRSHRELYVRVFGTPDSLRKLGTSLLSAVDALPSPLTSQQTIHPKDFGFGEADGNKRETYLSFHAEPSLDYLPNRQKRRTYLDGIFVSFLVVVVILTLVGLRTVWHWFV